MLIKHQRIHAFIGLKCFQETADHYFAKIVFKNLDSICYKSVELQNKFKTF